MIRRATIKDIDILIKLKIEILKEVRNDFGISDWSKYSQSLKIFYTNNLTNNTVIAFLSEENNSIIGFIVMNLYNVVPFLNCKNGRLAFLTDLYTLPKYRNSGVENALLNIIMDSAKTSGYSKVTLNTMNYDENLYEQYGFKDLQGEMSYTFL